MNTENEIKIPSDEAYPIINLIFERNIFKASEIDYRSLTITCLDLISKNRIAVNIDEEIKAKKINKHPIIKTKSYLKKELEIMECIEFTINSKHMKELANVEKTVLNMFKNINKSHTFNLKSMYEKMLNKKIAIKFNEAFQEYVKSLKREGKISDNEFKDIVEEGMFTFKGNELSNEWKKFKKTLKSKDFIEGKSDESLDIILLYGKCFEIDGAIISNIEKSKEDYDSDLYKFLKVNGAELLDLIFNAGIINSKVERKGDGSIPVGNSKYFVPGFG